MINPLLALCLFLSVNPLFSYIDGVFQLLLKNGKALIIMADAYSGYPKDWNQYSVPEILLSIREMAQKNPSKKVVFTYEDPSVYCVQEDLAKILQEFGDKFSRPSSKNFTGLMKLSKSCELLPMRFVTNEKFSSFLNGDLTEGLSLLIKEKDWPNNLLTKSNDPRIEFLGTLFLDELLGKYKNKIYLKDFLTVEKNFFDRLDKFTLTKEISQEKVHELYKMTHEFGRVYLEELEMFKLYMKEKNIELTIEDFNKSLQELENKVKIDDIGKYLKERKQKGDVFSFTPVLDVLMTILDENAPDLTIAILGCKNAQDLMNVLKNLDFIDIE